MNNATALSWALGIALASGLWVLAVDWCVVGIIRACHHRKIAARMDAVLGRGK